MTDQMANINGKTGMLITDGLYLKPSKSTRVLAILDALSRDSSLSQFELGKQLNLSGAMVNQYLKQLQSGGLVEFLPVNGKSYRYTLTEEGRFSRQKMFSDYSSETVRLYTTIKDFVLERLGTLLGKGETRLALFGASETCEVVLSALRDSDFQIMMLLDNDSRKQGQISTGMWFPHLMFWIRWTAMPWSLPHSAGRPRYTSSLSRIPKSADFKS